MSKTINFSTEARTKLKKGVDLLANSVKVTLGPKGRNVIIEKSYGPPHITKDGVSVAKEIDLADPFENIGAKLVQMVASKTCEDVGDGPQPLWSKIATPNGWVTMGEIKVGDQICGTNNTIQTVTGIFPKGKKVLYKVYFSNKQVVECCADHLWTIINSQGHLHNYTTAQLIAKGVYKLNKYGDKAYSFYVPKCSVEYMHKETPIDPFTLGVLLGDGYFPENPKYHVEITIGYNKVDKIVPRLVLPEGITISETDCPEKHAIKLRLIGKTENGKRLIDILNSLHLQGVGSENKFIPDNYLYNDFKSREALLEGLLITDGYINTRGLFEYSSISRTLADNIVSLCRSLGKTVTIYAYTDRDSAYGNKPVYRVTELKGYARGNKIIGIEETDIITEMQCIKVSNPDELYITNDFIVTHNTSTSSLLTQAIVAEGIRNLEAGAKPIDLKKGIDLAIASVVNYIKAIAIPIKGDYAKLQQVATISANNDPEIGALVTKAFKAVSDDGVITIEESKSSDTYISVVEGMQLNRGYVSPYFATNNETAECELEFPYFLLYDGKISNIKEIIKILDVVFNASKSLVIIANDFDSEAISTLVMNKVQKNFKICCVKSPGFGDNQREYLEDIAVITNASVINQGGFNHASVEDLGAAERVVITRDTTTIINGKSNPERLEKRIKEVKKEYAKSQDAKIYDRLGKLSGGVAIIYVGANSEVEMKEKKDRVDDALCATRAALEEGIVPGGGVTYLESLSVLEVLKQANSGDVTTGINIIKDAITKPLYTIASNAGKEGGAVVQETIRLLSTNKDHIGYNAKTDKYEDILEAGITDPAKVARVALENAASVGSLILTAGCVICNDVENANN